MSLNVTPPFPTHDIADHGVVHTELLTECDLRHPFRIEPANLPNVIFAQLSGRDFRPFQGGWSVPSLCHHVGLIVALRSKKQVAWPDTGRIIAMMADAQALWNCAAFQLPRNTSGNAWTTSTTADTDTSIASAICSSGPYPTRTKFRTMRRNWPVLVDFGPKSFFDWARFDRHKRAASRIEMVADTPRSGDGHRYSTRRACISINPKGVSHFSITDRSL